MSSAAHTPSVTPLGPSTMTTKNGATDIQQNLKESSSQKDMQDSIKRSGSLTIREVTEKIEVPSTQPPPVIEEQVVTQNLNSDQDMPDADTNPSSNESSASPLALEPFDWENFQARYDKAMAEAKATDQCLLNEFYELANYFGIWAAAAAKYDDDRALKRLKTRETYIQTAEKSLEEKKRHYTEVVEAFKKALALLEG